MPKMSAAAEEGVNLLKTAFDGQPTDSDDPKPEDKDKSKGAAPTDKDEPNDKDKGAEGGDEYTAEEQKAMEQGWDPDYDGEDAVSAKEFIARGSFFTKIKSQNKTIRSQADQLAKQKEQMQFLMERNKAAIEVGYNKALDDLRAQKHEAMEERDYTKVDAIDDKINDLREQHQKDKAKIDEFTAKDDDAVDPDEDTKKLVAQQINDFKTKHPWYDEASDDFDDEMSDIADVIGKRYLNKHGVEDDVSGVLGHIEKQMKKRFPDYFKEDDKAPRRKQRQRVEGGGRRPPSRQQQRDNGKYTVEDLDADERAIVRSMVRAGTIESEQAYVDQIAETGYFNQ